MGQRPRRALGRRRAQCRRGDRPGRRTLPRLTGLSYQHPGEGDGSRTMVGLARVRPAAAVPFQRLYGADWTENTGSVWKQVWVQGAHQSGAVKRIQNGWKYFLSVEATSPVPSLTAVGAIKVYYR